MKRGPKPKIITQEHAALYITGWSLHRIARKLGADETNVRNAIASMGISIRGPGGKPPYLCNQPH